MAPCDRPCVLEVSASMHDCEYVSVVSPPAARVAVAQAAVYEAALYDNVKRICFSLHVFAIGVICERVLLFPLLDIPNHQVLTQV